jgi:hypothetical protein
MRPLNLTAVAFASLSFTGLASAQNFTLTVDQANTNYTWNGTTSIGALEGNPSNAFQLSGNVEFNLATGGSPIGSGQWLSADMLVTPDLSGKIPNPLPFLPPLAIIDVAGMRFSISSDPFTVDAAGNFSTTSILVVTAGTLTVTPLTGGATVTDLTGTVGPASATTGSINLVSGEIKLVSPMATSFMFTDPQSGISATMGLNGTINAGYDCPAPTNYCVGAANSVGAGSSMASTGSTSMAAGSFALTADACPPNKPGLFFTGMNQISVPLGNGNLCLGGNVKRFPVVISDGAGVFSQSVDFNALPGGLVLNAGQNANFQCWYRDVQGGGAGFNLSDGLNVVLCP